MCVKRRLTRKELLLFPKWKKQLEEEDIKEFGEVVNRSNDAYFDLYRIYLSNKNNRP